MVDDLQKKKQFTEIWNLIKEDTQHKKTSLTDKLTYTNVAVGVSIAAAISAGALVTGGVFPNSHTGVPGISTNLAPNIPVGQAHNPSTEAFNALSIVEPLPMSNTSVMTRTDNALFGYNEGLNEVLKLGNTHDLHNNPTPNQEGGYLDKKNMLIDIQELMLNKTPVSLMHEICSYTDTNDNKYQITGQPISHKNAAYFDMALHKVATGQAISHTNNNTTNEYQITAQPISHKNAAHFDMALHKVATGQAISHTNNHTTNKYQSTGRSISHTNAPHLDMALHKSFAQDLHRVAYDPTNAISYDVHPDLLLQLLTEKMNNLPKTKTDDSGDLNNSVIDIHTANEIKKNRAIKTLFDETQNLCNEKEKCQRIISILKEIITANDTAICIIQSSKNVIETITIQKILNSNTTYAMKQLNKLEQTKKNSIQSAINIVECGKRNSGIFLCENTLNNCISAIQTDMLNNNADYPYQNNTTKSISRTVSRSTNESLDVASVHKNLTIQCTLTGCSEYDARKREHCDQNWPKQQANLQPKYSWLTESSAGPNQLQVALDLQMHSSNMSYNLSQTNEEQTSDEIPVRWSKDTQYILLQCVQTGISHHGTVVSKDSKDSNDGPKDKCQTNTRIVQNVGGLIISIQNLFNQLHQTPFSFTDTINRISEEIKNRLSQLPTDVNVPVLSLGKGLSQYAQDVTDFISAYFSVQQEHRKICPSVSDPEFCNKFSPSTINTCVDADEPTRLVIEEFCERNSGLCKYFQDRLADTQAKIKSLVSSMSAGNFGHNIVIAVAKCITDTKKTMSGEWDWDMLYTQMHNIYNNSIQKHITEANNCQYNDMCMFFILACMCPVYRYTSLRNTLSSPIVLANEHAKDFHNTEYQDILIAQTCYKSCEACIRIIIKFQSHLLYNALDAIFDKMSCVSYHKKIIEFFQGMLDIPSDTDFFGKADAGALRTLVMKLLTDLDKNGTIEQTESMVYTDILLLRFNSAILACHIRANVRVNTGTRLSSCVLPPIHSYVPLMDKLCSTKKKKIQREQNTNTSKSRPSIIRTVSEVVVA